MLPTVLRGVRDRARSTARSAAARAIGVPLEEHPSAAQDDRPTPELLREIFRLRIANLTSRRRVVDPQGTAVVSMTTHGARIRLVWVALESIALPVFALFFLDSGFWDALPVLLLIVPVQPRVTRLEALDVFAPRLNDRSYLLVDDRVPEWN